jgi:hypothetical protein
MASSRGIRAGRAFVELFTDNSKLVRGLRQAGRRLRAFGDRVRNMGMRTAAIGGAMVAPLLGAAKAFSSMGDQVAKMAKRTGLSVEALSELRFAASQSGTSLEAMETGFRRMQRSIYDAGRGLSTQTDALADLGLKYEDLAGLSPEDQFKSLAEAISRVEDPTRKAALAQALFGRAGTQLLPMFAQGAKGIEALQAEARRLGLTMSGEDVKAAEEFTDALDTLWLVVKMGVFNVGAALAPVLQQVAETFTSVAMKVSAWVKANQQAIVTALKVAATVAAVGISLVAIGGALSAAGSLMTMLAGAIALVLSPVGLLVAGLAALGGELVDTYGVGQTFAAKLGSVFAAIRDVAIGVLSRVVFALTHFGDSFRYVLAEAAYQVVRFYGLLKHWLGQIPTLVQWVVDNWRELFTDAWNLLQTFGSNVAKNLSNLWDAIVSFVSGEGFSFEWTGLLDGFESQLKEMPKIVERVASETEKDLERRRDDIYEDLAKEFEEHDRNFRAQFAGEVEPGQGSPAVTGPTLADELRTAWAGLARGVQADDPIAPRLGSERQKLEASGAFNAAALLGLQAGGVAAREERMVDGIDKIERNTRALRDADELRFAQ